MSICCYPLKDCRGGTFRITKDLFNATVLCMRKCCVGFCGEMDRSLSWEKRKKDSMMQAACLGLDQVTCHQLAQLRTEKEGSKRVPGFAIIQPIPEHSSLPESIGHSLRTA